MGRHPSESMAENGEATARVSVPTRATGTHARNVRSDVTTRRNVVTSATLTPARACGRVPVPEDGFSGLACRACHVRAGCMIGQPPEARVRSHSGLRSSHNGLRTERAFGCAGGQPRLCVRSHRAGSSFEKNRQGARVMKKVEGGGGGGAPPQLTIGYTGRMASSRPAPERFWSYVTRGSGEGPGCWVWWGTLSDKGYGIFWDGKRQVRAHRYAYELLVGPIPEGKVLHHTCYVHWCVNPSHLKPTDDLTNARDNENSRKTHCIRGHEFTPENTRVRSHSGASHGGRECRTCRRMGKNGRALPKA